MSQRSWNADRFFPLLPGTAELTCVLSAGKARTWFARTPFGNRTCRASRLGGPGRNRPATRPPGRPAARV
ncbi:hypothetical protein [Streptomyces sp. NPDC004546]|uniref:hypothetical protein n=1 Tax=Streptomyces sp. NPDC004546 TaxID=3154282 RepID=UPI0033BF425F